MSLEEIIEKKQLATQEINNILNKLADETGCKIELNFNYENIYTIGGSRLTNTKQVFCCEIEIKI